MISGKNIFRPGFCLLFFVVLTTANLVPEKSLGHGGVGGGFGGYDISGIPTELDGQSVQWIPFKRFKGDAFTLVCPQFSIVGKQIVIDGNPTNKLDLIFVRNSDGLIQFQFQSGFEARTFKTDTTEEVHFSTGNRYNLSLETYHLKFTTPIKFLNSTYVNPDKRILVSIDAKFESPLAKIFYDPVYWLKNEDMLMMPLGHVITSGFFCDGTIE